MSFFYARMGDLLADGSVLFPIIMITGNFEPGKRTMIPDKKLIN
jgi:hypothetical protein